MLLFIRFTPRWHIVSIRMDCLGIDQANVYLGILHMLRERLWHQLNLCYKWINVSIDTTVEIFYSSQQLIRRG